MPDPEKIAEALGASRRQRIDPKWRPHFTFPELCALGADDTVTDDEMGAAFRAWQRAADPAPAASGSEVSDG